MSFYVIQISRMNLKKIYSSLFFTFLLIACYSQNNPINDSVLKNNVIISCNLKGSDFDMVPIHTVNEFFELKRINFNNYSYDTLSGNFKASFTLKHPELMKFFLKDVFVTPGDSVHLEYLVLDTVPEYHDTLIITGINQFNYQYYKYFKSRIKQYENNFPNYKQPFNKVSFEQYRIELRNYYSKLRSEILASFKRNGGTDLYKKLVLNNLQRHELNKLWGNIISQNRRWLDKKQKIEFKKALLSQVDKKSKEFNEDLIILHKIFSNDSILNYTLPEFQNLEKNALTFPSDLKEYLITADIIEFIQNKRTADTNLILKLTESSRKITSSLYKKKLAEYGLATLTATTNFNAKFNLIKLTNLQGEIVTLGSIISKKMNHTVYLDFWASWCGPCRSETPYFNKLVYKFKNKSIDFIQISVDEDKTEWKNAVKNDSSQLSKNYCFFNTNDFLIITEQFKFTGVPYYLIIDKKGNIAVKNAPRPSDPKLKTLLANILKKQ